MSEKNLTTYNLFIWKSNDWEYIFLQEAFEYREWRLKWLNWTYFNFLTQSDLDDRIEDYDWYELWKEAVQAEQTTSSFIDWEDEVKDCWDAEWVARDSSYEDEDWLQKAMEYANKKEETDYEYSDCIWCWRMFNEENIKEDYYEYFIPENLEILKKEYNKYEK